jgi:hypothetical protein
MEKWDLEYDRLIRKKYADIMGGAYIQPPPPMAPVNKPDKFSDEALKSMLFSRMRWDSQPFQRLITTKLNDTTVVVFLIHNGRALTIEDDINLYPTDGLITQLRLLGEK